MKKIQILLLMAYVALCLSDCAPEPMQSEDNPFLIGGVEQVSTSDPKVNQLVERVNEFNYNKTDDYEYVWLVTCVKKATKQLVNGLKWTIDATLGQTNCIKKSIEFKYLNSIETKIICSFRDYDEKVRHYVIYEKPWLNLIKVYSETNNV